MASNSSRRAEPEIPALLHILHIIHTISGLKQDMMDTSPTTLEMSRKSGIWNPVRIMSLLLWDFLLNQKSLLTEYAGANNESACLSPRQDHVDDDGNAYDDLEWEEWVKKLEATNKRVEEWRANVRDSGLDPNKIDYIEIDWVLNFVGWEFLFGIFLSLGDWYGTTAICGAGTGMLLSS